MTATGKYPYLYLLPSRPLFKRLRQFRCIGNKIRYNTTRLFVNIVELHEIRKVTTAIMIVEFHYRKETAMTLSEAIVMRIEKVCKEKGVSICDACLSGGMSLSAIYDICKGRTKSSKVVTILRFCEGAGITLAEFFDCDVFQGLDD